MKPEALLINLNDYRQSGEGANGASYDCIADPNVMVKLYNEDYPTDTIYTELEVARKVFDAGIPSPQPGELVTDGKRIGIRFRRIVGKRSHARAVSQEPERVAEYAVEFAQMCKKLHSTTLPKGYFPDAKQQFIHLVEADKSFSPEEKAPILDFIHNLPDANTAIHGDMHFGNTLTTLPKGAPMSDPHELYFIDLGYFAQGYPLFDLGMLQNVCLFTDEDFRVENFHMGRDLTAKFWDAFVDEYFFGEENLSEKYFGKGATKELVNEKIKYFTSIKLFLVSFNLGVMLPHYGALIRKTFGL